MYDDTSVTLASSRFVHDGDYERYLRMHPSMKSYNSLTPSIRIIVAHRIDLFIRRCIEIAFAVLSLYWQSCLSRSR